MALDMPVPVTRRTRLHVLGPDTTTSRGYVTPEAGATGKHSKRFGECGLTLTVSVADAVLGVDETALLDAFLVPEVYDEVTGAFVARGTPYMLSPGTGTVVGRAGRDQSPVAVGALHGMLDTLEVVPTEVDKDHATFRRCGGLEHNRYWNFGSKGYQESLHTWYDADEYDPTGHPKQGKPTNFPTVLIAAGAKPIFRNADEGGRTCYRPPTYTLTEDQRVVFWYVSDENGKMGVDGPNSGGVVVNFTADEDGWQQGAVKETFRQKAGTYRPWAWSLTINSTGGDGNDSAMFGAYSIKTDGSGDIDQVLFVSDANTRVLRQPVDDEIPGMSVGEVIRRALEELVALGGSDATYAQILLDNRTFTDALNTAGNDWTHLKEWVWPLGTSLASALSDMLSDCDLDMGVDFSFNGWNDRTKDRGATPGSGLSTVELQPGTDPPTAACNVLDYDYDSDPPGPNAFVVDTEDGLTYHDASLSAGEFRRFGYLEAGSSGSIGRGKAAARAEIQARGDTRRYYHARILAVADATPYVDFDPTDVVHGRGYRNLGLDLEVTAVTWEQGDTTTYLLDLAAP